MFIIFAYLDYYHYLCSGNWVCTKRSIRNSGRPRKSITSDHSCTSITNLCTVRGYKTLTKHDRY